MSCVNGSGPVPVNEQETCHFEVGNLACSLHVPFGEEKERQQIGKCISYQVGMPDTVCQTDSDPSAIINNSYWTGTRAATVLIVNTHSIACQCRAVVFFVSIWCEEGRGVGDSKLYR
jgi:hypothetical protein